MRIPATLWILLGAVVVGGLAGFGVQSGLASEGASAPPAYVTPPQITGLQPGQTLSVSQGTWTGTTPMSFFYTWQRGDGTSFTPIPGATGSTYTITPADVGHDFLVQVKAQNSLGPAWANSAPTVFVTGPTAADTQPLGGGLISVLVDHVTLPDRLVVQAPAFSPAKLGAARSVTATFRVLDSSGYPVRGALVQVVALPFGALKPLAEATTRPDGTVTMTLTATAVGLHPPGGAIALSVRARKPGDNVLTGVTGTRLVELPVAR